MSNAFILKILEDFVEVSTLAGLRITLAELKIEESPPPHAKPKTLPAGLVAVYMFKYGDKFLKIGKAGPKSVARYCSQHYGVNAPSTLAKSLIQHQARLNLSGLEEANIGNWICRNTTRINVLFSANHGPAALSLLESFLHCRLNPMFEGFESQKIIAQPASSRHLREKALQVASNNALATALVENIERNNLN